ncbi:hypothetical protein Tco_1361998, partial [Tanacetum coccineum]
IDVELAVRMFKPNTLAEVYHLSKIQQADNKVNKQSDQKYAPGHSCKGLERISKKRTKNEAKTTKPDTEWKSVEKTKSRQSPSLNKSTKGKKEILARVISANPPKM